MILFLIKDAISQYLRANAETILIILKKKKLYDWMQEKLVRGIKSWNMKIREPWMA